MADTVPDAQGNGVSHRLSTQIDCTSLLPVELAGLNRSVYVRSICFHPEKPLLAVGVPGFVGAYDLDSGCRVGRIDIRATAIELRYSQDASLLVVATAEWDIVGINTGTWRPSRIAPRTDVPDKPLDAVHVALLNGASPVVLFCKHGKDAVRMAYANRAIHKDSKGRTVREKEHKWGIKLKMDTKKPVVGLAAHPCSNHVMVYHADGILRGYQLAGDGSLTPLYAAPVEFTVGAKVAPAYNTLEVVPHPFVQGAALLLQGSRAGAFEVMEVVGQSEPKVLLKTKVHGAIIGIGYIRNTRTILAYSKNELGVVSNHAWQVYGSTLKPGQLTVGKAEVAPALLGDVIHSDQEKIEIGELEEVDSAADAWQQLWAPTTPWFSNSPDSGVESLTPEVARVALHHSMGLLAVQLQPPRQARLQPALMAQSAQGMTPAEIAVLRSTLSIPVAFTLPNDVPHLGWGGTNYAPMHTGINFWTLGPGSKLQFPRHLYYLGADHAMKYTLTTKTGSKFIKLPTKDSEGRSVVKTHMVHSSKRGAWLMAFEVTERLKEGEEEERFAWTLVRETTIGFQEGELFLNPGKLGVFIGANDNQFAILNTSGTLVSLYPTDTTTSTTTPLYTISLIRPNLSTPHIFSGPPCAQTPTVPQPPAPPQFTPTNTPPSSSPDLVALDEPEVVVQQSGGVILWTCSDGALAMGDLPAPPAEVVKGLPPNMGKVKRERTLKLLPDEKVLQVTWQELQPGLGQDANSYAAAILTTERLMLVSAMMKVIAATEPLGSSIAALPVTSFVWVGPALLYTTCSGQVMQLTWTGQSVLVCSVASHPAVMLGGVLADTLILLRPVPLLPGAPSANAGWEVTSRVVSLLQPLVLGWCTLASCQLLPNALTIARQALQSITEQYDATNVSASMLWRLISCWYWDVAAVLANFASHADPSAKLAANAAAGRWDKVASNVLQEYERSVYVPFPPPHGSALHSKLMAAACGSINHGQFSQAQRCLRAAGEWETCMVLMICQGNMEGVREVALQLQKSASVGSADLQLGIGETVKAAELARMARALAVSHAGVASAGTKDWKAKLVAADGNAVQLADGWKLARAGCLPSMITVAPTTPPQLIEAGELGSIPSADTATLGAYLGLSDLVATELAPSVRPSVEGGDMMMLDGGMDVLGDGAASSDSDTEGKKEGTDKTVKVSKRATKDSFFSSDDEDLSPNSRRFKIQIRNKEDVSTPTGSTSSLKDAAKNLTLDASPTKLKKANQGNNSPSSMDPFDSLFKNSPRGSAPVSAASSSTTLNIAGPPTASTLSPSVPTPPGTTPNPSTLSADPFGDDLFGFGTPSKTLPTPTSTIPTPSSTQPDPFGDDPFGITPTRSPVGAPPTTVPTLAPPPNAQRTNSPFGDDFFGFSASAPAAVASTNPSSKPSLILPPPPGSAPKPSPASTAARSSSPFGDDFFSTPSAPSTAAATPFLAPPPGQPRPPAVSSSGGAGALDDLLGLGPAPAPKPAAATSGSQPLDLDDLLGIGGPPPPKAVSAPAPAAPAAAAPTLSGSSTELYVVGVQNMETANWTAARSAFAQALSALEKEQKGGNHAQRVAFCAQYYAAVRLLEQATGGTGTREARLYRFASALKLDEKHQMALLKESVTRNKALKNYRYCADQLTVLITKCLGTAPMEYMAKLQESIDECDRAGNTNDSIPADEKMEIFVEIVAAATTAADVDVVVESIILL